VLALAVAGYFFLYANAGAAWRFSVAPEVGQGASSSFLLPLHAKAKQSTDAALEARGNAFQDRCVRAPGARIRFRLLCPTVKRFAPEDYRNKLVVWEFRKRKGVLLAVLGTKVVFDGFGYSVFVQLEFGSLLIIRSRS
jgi:hypothetical protein